MTSLIAEDFFRRYAISLTPVPALYGASDSLNDRAPADVGIPPTGYFESSFSSHL